MGPIKPPPRHTKKCYINTATYYTIKWVETKALKDNTMKFTAKFLYEEIITKFGCPVELVNDQGHFMNDIIRIMTKEFMILHRRSTTYYSQANG